jgi:putative phage-type endonuclease
MNAPVQGTQEWLAERAGHATASRFADVLATIKTGEAASRRAYRMQLVTERLTGNPVVGYTNAAMAWGTMTEPEARQAYEAHTGVLVDQVGFVKHKIIPWCGASPDGRIEHDGLVEIKCPESTTHLEWLEAGKAPSKHIPQIQGQLWVENRQWCDFVSYDPRFPENLQLFIVRVNRDDEYIKALETAVKEFLGGVDEMVKRLLAK